MLARIRDVQITEINASAEPVFPAGNGGEDFIGPSNGAILIYPTIG